MGNQSGQRASAILVNNTLSMPAGSQITTEEYLVFPGRGSGIFMGDLCGAMLCISSLVEGVETVLGTAFLVKPGVALTAKHVVSELQLLPPTTVVIVSGIYEGELRCWDIRGGVTCNSLDAAILTLVPRFRLGHTVTFNHFVLSARTPVAGEMIIGLGLKASKETFEASENIEVVPICSSGAVVAVRRSRPFYSTPALETDMVMLGGMSGGPVFDAEGCVVGINSSSIDHGDGSFTSFVTLLYPTFNDQFSPVWPTGMFPQPSRLMDFNVRHADLLTFEEGRVFYRGNLG